MGFFSQVDDLKEVQSSEFVVVQSSLVLWLNQFSVWFCFRQCVRQSRQRRNSPLHHSGLTSTAWRTALLFSSISHRATWPNPFHTSVSNCLCSIVVCQFAHGRMEIGLWKMKKHQSIVARPSPALVVLFWAAFAMLRFRLMSLFKTFLCIFVLLPPLSIQVRLLWFHDTISVSVSLSFLGNLQWLDGNGVPWSQWQILALMRVCLLLCRLRLSKSNESTNVGVYVVY